MRCRRREAARGRERETKRRRRGILRLNLLQLTSLLLALDYTLSLISATALLSGPPSFVALASTYQDFLKPAPQDGWDQLNNYESLDLLASEEAAERERVRLEKLKKKEDQAALKSRDRLRRKERWAQLLGSGKQRWVFFVFGALIAIGLVLYFVIPRGPGVGWGNQSSSTAFTSTNTSGTYQTTPTNFDFSAELSLDFDARSSYIPTKLSDLTAEVFDLNTGVSIGSGKKEGSTRLAARDVTTVKLPLLFQMSFTNTSSTTYSDVIRSCTTAGSTFPLTFSFSFKIAGTIGSHSAKLQSQDLTCPVTLAERS